MRCDPTSTTESATLLARNKPRRAGARLLAGLVASTSLFALAGPVQHAEAAGPAGWLSTVTGQFNQSVVDSAVTAGGSLYTVGYFEDEATWTGTNSSLTLTSSGDRDVFLARYSTSGGLLWVRTIASSDWDRVSSVSVAGDGSVFVGGAVKATATLASPGGSPTISPTGGGYDGFVAKYDADGNAQWARRMGGAGGDEVEDVSAAADGSVYVGGHVNGDSDGTFGTTGGSAPYQGIGAGDGFLVHYTTSGNIAGSRIVGGSAEDGVNGVAAVPTGGVVVTGYFAGTAAFGPSVASTLSSAGADDVVVARYDANVAPQWVRRAGSTSSDIGDTVTVDDGGRIFVGGRFEGTATFGTGPAQATLQSSGGDDGFHGSYDLDGSFRWARKVGGLQDDQVSDIAVDAAGGVHVVGTFEKQGNVQGTTGPGQTLNAAGGAKDDAFVATFDVDGGLASAEADGGTEDDGARSVAATPSGTVVVTGYANGDAAFGSPPNEQHLEGVHFQEGFAVRYEQGPAFHAVTPARIMDTRDGTGGPAGRLGPGGTRELVVAGHGGVAPNATSVVLNVTVTNTTAESHLTVWPTGVPKPLASNLNFRANATVPNQVQVKLGAGGKVSIYNNSGQADVIVDVLGWYDRDGSGDRFVGVTPDRVLDTRNGTGGPQAKIGAGLTRTLTIGALPANATGVVLNVTATNATAGTHLTVWPHGVSKPLASSLNVVAGQTVPNLVTVKVGTGKSVDIFNNAGSVDVIADLVGYYVPDDEASSFVGITPTRIIDTRDGTGLSGPFGPAQTRTKSMPIDVVPADADAVVLNVTVTGPTQPSHLTVFPGGTSVPEASNLNVVGGQTVANLVVVELGAFKNIGIYNNSGSIHVVADVVGWLG